VSLSLTGRGKRATNENCNGEGTRSFCLPADVEIFEAVEEAGAVPAPVGTRTDLGGRNPSTQVFETGRPTRIDSYEDFSGPMGNRARRVGFQAGRRRAGPCRGRMWGVMIVASVREPLPADTEERLASFTELAGTALANAEAQAALVGSRARGSWPPRRHGG